MPTPAIFIGAAVLILLGACGESSEDVYERGYEDGIDDVCSDVSRFSDRIYDVLRGERIC